MKISDEIREWCNLPQAFSIPCDELHELADRIDREMVELPRSVDGEVIHTGDTVYTEDGRKAIVTKICYLRDEVEVDCDWLLDITSNRGFINDTSIVSHEPPDSFERIADDIELAEKWCDQNGSYSTGISSVGESTLREWADRIRKLAKEDE